MRGRGRVPSWTGAIAPGRWELAHRRRVGLLALAAMSGLAGCVPDEPARSKAEDGPGCDAVLATLVDALGRRGAPVAGVGGWPGGDELRIPVGSVGDWVVGTGPTSGSPDRVVRIQDGRIVASDSREDACAGVAARLAEVPRDGDVRPLGARPTDPAVGSGRWPGVRVGEPAGGGSRGDRGATFADADLRAALARHPEGVVIYVWAPHMPLSVDGYREIADAAGRAGLALEPVLFRGADLAFARREAERVGIPEVGLREAASAELALRDAQVHAPALLVFRGDRVSPVLPGYRDAAGYVRWLEAFLVGDAP